MSTKAVDLFNKTSAAIRPLSIAWRMRFVFCSKPFRSSGISYRQTAMGRADCLLAHDPQREHSNILETNGWFNNGR